jgi:hypothetical protein
MEKWREKAIKYLEQSKDEEIKKAIDVLKKGQGYLISKTPTRVIFYSDIK